MVRTFTFLAALAILSLASMPFGYMPDRAADGRLILRICDGTMPMQHDPDPQMQAMTMLAAGHAEHSPDEHGATDDHQMRCNYAVAGLAPLPDAPSIATVVAIPQLAAPTIPDAMTGIFPPNLPPSTGPPLV